jgi:hypothetical protein
MTEEPRYVSQRKEGQFEVRDYPALITAGVTVGGAREQAGAEGFDLLSAYLFGDNTAPDAQRSETIPVTVPVILSGAQGGWTVRIVMPSIYAFDTLPTPNNARVQLAVVPPARLAVLQFSGLAHDEEVQRKTQELQSLLRANSLLASGPAALARYSAPWTPWYLRRNEVMVPLLH